MQNAGLQYVEGVTPLPESPFGVTQMQNNGTSSSTSSLRQFRKKDNVDKSPGAAGAHSVSSSRADSLSSSHVARVAPHNHYPPKQNEYFRYPQYQEFSSPYKEHTVKYSEIAEPVPQAIPHLEHLPPSVLSKHKEKDFPEMCNIPQQSHLNKPFPDHQFNGQQNYPTEMALHHQYMQKEPQGPQMHSPFKPESQYIPKEGTFNHQISPFLKYNIPTQSRNYGHLENPSLGSFQRLDPHIARSLMSDHPHIRDFPADYGAMEQGRMYTQKQRYYPAHMPPSNPTYPPNYSHRNIPAQQYNYPNCNYPRTAQVNSSMGRYPINMDRSMSPRRSYPENLDIGMNYSSVPQKISSAYPNYPAYAQHYQHRRPTAAPQEYYHHQQHPHARSHPQYMPTHHPQEVGENHVASNNIRQYLENWAEEESTTEISPQIESSKFIPRINRDEANEVYVINASELPQYLESGVPLVTSENGQYVFKSNVSIDNTGAIKIVEKNVENAVLPPDAQERVVSLHIIENPKADCLINTRTTNINQEHPVSGNQIPAATINVITTNTNHSNQEHTVQQSYNVATPNFNANRMNLMHHIAPINQNEPKLNQNYETSCLHTLPEENNSPQESIMSNSAASLDNAVRLSPQMKSVEKSAELCQKIQNNAVSEESSLEKNRLKIQVLSYQEVPQNSCIVMPSTQSRLNFDESLLPNQVPSDAKGAKNEFEVRNNHDDSTISNVITNNDNILNEAHEELDKIVEDTLTSSNISISLMSCERNDLPKIQDKCDSANSRIPDDLNLDLESNPKDSTNTESSYRLENSCNNQNEDIIDLSTSRRGSNNDNEEQNIKLSISSVQNKLEQIVQEAHKNILNEYSTTNNDQISTNSNTEEHDGQSLKASIKHMPLIEDHSETSAARSESLVSPDIVVTQKNSVVYDVVDQSKNEESTAANIIQEKKESEEIDLSLVAELSTVQSEICDTSIIEDFPQSGSRQDNEITNSLDTSLEAKISEIVGEPFELTEKPLNTDKCAEMPVEEKRKYEKDNDCNEVEDNEHVEKKSKTESGSLGFNHSLELSKNVNVIEEAADVMCVEPAALIEDVKETPSKVISDDSPELKKREGSRKQRIFSVDDIIYRIGPTTVQSRRDSIHSVPDTNGTPDMLIEENNAQDNFQIISNKDSDSNLMNKKEDSSEIEETPQDLKIIEQIPDSVSNLPDKYSKDESPLFTFKNSKTTGNDNNSTENNIISMNSEEKNKSVVSTVMVEKEKYLGYEETNANFNKTEEDNSAKKHLYPKDSRDIGIFNSIETEVLSHLLASESIISMDRTFEFKSFITSNSPKKDLLEKTECEHLNMIIVKSPVYKERQNEELEVSKNLEKENEIEDVHNEKQINSAPEINANHQKSEEIALYFSKQSDRVDDNLVSDCSEVKNEVEHCHKSSEIVTSEISNVELEVLCVENTNKEQQNTYSVNTDTSLDVKIEEHIENYNTSNINEKSLKTASPLSGCRFSVIHKIDDTKRITHQEEIRIDDNYEASMTKVADLKAHKQTIKEFHTFEQKTSEIKLSTDHILEFNKENVPNKSLAQSNAATRNHCSVIQSIECTLQDGIKEKKLEKIESELEEKSSGRVDYINKLNDTTNEHILDCEISSIKVLGSDHAENDNFSNNGSQLLKAVVCGEEASKTGEHLKPTFSLKKEELTFEQKFVEPFCNKNEEIIEKIGDIEEKPSEEVQYRSVLKIEENNVLLEICGELVEIIVNQVNGKKVITVIPISSSATVDFNDNYEHVDRTQLCGENEVIDINEDFRNDQEIPNILEKSVEESRSENADNENLSEFAKLIKNSEDDETNNGCEFISSSLSESIGEIFEDIILNENEIIIGDESLEEEINLELQSKSVLDDVEPNFKPAVCTKAAKKLYDDIALHTPPKTYSALRDFRRIKNKPDSSITDYKKTGNQPKRKRSSKHSVRISARKRVVSEQNEGSKTALRELIERRKMRKEKIRLKYTQYAKQESKIHPTSIETDSMSIAKDETTVSTVPMNERMTISSDLKKVRCNVERKAKELKERIQKCNEKILKKPVEKKNETSEQDYLRLLKQQEIASNLEVGKKKLEEKPSSTSVIVSSSIPTPKSFQEAGSSTVKELSKNSSYQEKSTKFPKISTPRDLSLTKNVNEHYLSRKDHSNLKKKLSIQEYNSRKRKSVDCKNPVPEKCFKSTDDDYNVHAQDRIKAMTTSTIYSDKQFECFSNSVKDPRRRPHFVNMQSTKLQRLESLSKSQTQSISSSRTHKQNESSQLTNCEKLKDPLLNSNESSVASVQNRQTCKRLLGKLSPDTHIPTATKISSRRKTIEVMYDRKFETTELTKKKVSFDDNVQINEINTTQSKSSSIKSEATNDCEVSSSCSDIVEDKTNEDGTDCTTELNTSEGRNDAKIMKIESEEERKNDWEGSNSPKDSITDVFAASFLEKTKIDTIKNKGKCIIDISDFDTSLISNELKTQHGVTFNSNPILEDAGSLRDYKEAVDSKLNSLSIQIPKSTKSRIQNEDDVLIHKFLRKEQLNSEEIKQIRRIIYLKKKIQQMTHQNSNTKSENDSYEVKKKFESNSQKDLKLQLKKIDGRIKKKKKRFRNLYSKSPESNENYVQGTAGEFSVYEGENLSGVKLIFRRKTELMQLQPVVKLQRCKYIESMAKKLKFE